VSPSASLSPTPDVAFSSAHSRKKYAQLKKIFVNLGGFENRDVEGTDEVGDSRLGDQK
jgi:hypothetical protein